MGRIVAGLVVVPSLPSESLRQLSETDVRIVALDRRGRRDCRRGRCRDLGGAQDCGQPLQSEMAQENACVGYDNRRQDFLRC